MAALVDSYERSLRLLNLMLPEGNHNIQSLIDKYKPADWRKQTSRLRSRFKVSYGDCFLFEWRPLCCWLPQLTSMCSKASTLSASDQG